MEGTENGVVKLSTGVVLKVRRINPMVLDFNLRHNLPPVPKAPKVFIEAKGREEENPNHPEYIAAVDAYNAERGAIVQDTLVGLGTEVESIPKGFDKPEGTEWVEQLGATGMKVPEGKFKRYIFWVNYWACQTAQDAVGVVTAVTQGVATPEVEVAAAAESFRGGEERRTRAKPPHKTRG